MPDVFKASKAILVPYLSLVAYRFIILINSSTENVKKDNQTIEFFTRNTAPAERISP